MAQRSKRNHVETEQLRETRPEPSISQLAGQLAYAIAKKVMRRVFARPLRVIEHARASFVPHTEAK